MAAVVYAVTSDGISPGLRGVDRRPNLGQIAKNPDLFVRRSSWVGKTVRVQLAWREPHG